MAHSQEKALSFELYGDTVKIAADQTIMVDFSAPLSKESILTFYNSIESAHYQPIIASLLAFKEKHQLDDWFFYQLIRKTAQQLSPKADNYNRYTLYKWFFLCKSGYDAKLGIDGDELKFYVRCNENIYDIPYYTQGGAQYVCLNIHDYAGWNSDAADMVSRVDIQMPEAQRAFSYKISQIPEFTAADYTEKDLRFSYGAEDYHFKVKLNPKLQNVFLNYPVTDYESYFNIPLSNETYSSFIPVLKKQVHGMKEKQGVDFLMRFTREAFLYKTDEKNFGKEKRLSPEQTLLNQYSDCDDRAALFFYLVKEIYNIPMIVLVYPTHVTVAVKFDRPPGGDLIVYNGSSYSVCEPTPQSRDLRIGQLSPELKKVSYEVAFAYEPHKK